MSKGYVKLYRKTLDSGMLGNHKLWCFWCWCLMKATHKEHRVTVGFQEILLKPGDFIFGLKRAAEELNLTIQKVRTCLKHLESTQKITIKTTNKFSIISIVKWDTYQTDGKQSNKQSNKEVTNEQQTSNKPLTTNKNGKNGKNGKKADSPESANDIYKTKKGRVLSGKRLESFNRFWIAFDYKRGKAAAADSWLDIPALTNAVVEQICVSAAQEAQARQELEAAGRSPKWAQGWLTERRWEDECYQQNNNHGGPIVKTREQLNHEIEELMK